MTIMEEIIESRHSTRNFKPDKPIDRETQARILNAGLRAPSPKNRQPWEFVVLDNPKDIARAADILDGALEVLRSERNALEIDDADLKSAALTSKTIRTAPLVIFVGYCRDDSNEHGETMDWSLSAQGFEVADIQSIGACIENMLLAAESMGISSLWMCDVLHAEQIYRCEYGMTSPIVAAVAFGMESRHRVLRSTLEEKARWISK